MKSEAINNAINQNLQQILPLQIAYWLGELATDNLELFSQLLSCAFKYKESSIKHDLLQILPLEIVHKSYIKRDPQSLAELKFALPYLQSMDIPVAHYLSAQLYLNGHGDKQGVEAKKAAFRHLKAYVDHVGFTQLRPVHQAANHCWLADSYFDGHGDKQGVEAKKSSI